MTRVPRLLLDRGADTSIRDNSGFSPVENAIREHQTGIVRLFLEQSKDSPTLSRLLERAVATRQEDMVYTLLAGGAPIDGHFASGSTALYDAALAGDAAIVNLLLSRGANANERDAATLTTPLYAAAAFDRQEAVSALLLWGANPDLAGKEGFTPLHAAELNGYRKIAKQIRNAGDH